jgi:hypothetical protein
MAIEVVPEQLYALAGVLDAAAVSAARIAPDLTGDPAGNRVGGRLGAAVAGFTETTGTAGRCLAGELSWLGAAVAADADSWLGLDAFLLPRPGLAVPE